MPARASSATVRLTATSAISAPSSNRPAAIRSRQCMALATAWPRPDMRRRLPGIRTLLIATYLAVLLLPVGGIGFLRLYESALIRQTESELLAQAAVLSAAYRVAWLERATSADLAAMPRATVEWGTAPAP